MSQTQEKPDGIDKWTLYDVENDNANHFEDRSTAEEKAEHAEDDLGLNVEVYPPGEHPDISDPGPRIEDGAADVEVIEEGDTPDEDVLGAPDNADATETEVVQDEPSNDVAEAPEFAGDLDISQDPLNVLPGWMTTQVSYNDRGDSSTTVNKRGCQVIAEYLNLETEHIDSEIEKAHENDFEYAHYVIEVTKEDGRSFRGHGTARADDADQGEGAGWKLNMMAETRAYKRSVKAATGGGIEAFAKEQGGR